MPYIENVGTGKAQTLQSCNHIVYEFVRALPKRIFAGETSLLPASFEFFAPGQDNGWFIFQDPDRFP